MAVADDRWAWDRYWHADRVASCMDGAGSSNYDARIAEAWAEHFAVLPRRTRILDLCTGNGAIAVMAMEASPGFEVTGVDLASIEPAAFVSSNLDQLRRIRFVPNMPAEALSLPAGGFDAVVSQYGIEYSDMDRSLPEAVRMLAPGGRLRFAMHAAEGAVAADTRRSIGEAEFLLDEIDLTGRAERCLAAPSPETEAGFQEGLKAAENRIPDAVDVAMLSTVHRLLKQNYDERHSVDRETLIGWARALHDDIAAHRERQRALLGSALSSDELAGLTERLESLGLTDVTTGEQRDGSNLIAHTIAARRPA